MEDHAAKNNERRRKPVRGLDNASRLKKTSIILLCLVLFLCAIYITDISTRRMMLSDDDRRAIGVYSIGSDTLRIDLAGEHYMLNYKEVKKITGNLIGESKKLIKDVAGKVKNINGDK